MTHPAVCHRDCEAGDTRGEPHIALDMLPDVEDLPAAKGADIVCSFDEDRILQPLTDRPRVVLDEPRELVGG